MAELPVQETPDTARWSRSRSLVVAACVAIILPATYGLAWWDAYRLGSRYAEDADASLQDGRYLDALLGYEEFDRAAGRYVTRGGYIQVHRIWDNTYAFPKPAEARRAEQAIDEIIYERLTLDDAERFVQANIGRRNPYLGLIYLRLGELYEADGRLREAQEVYESVPGLFRDDAALIARARADLDNLLAQQAN